ncbi:hypothetical protein [Flavobacterium sp.]|uniref:hypothetical protein n=1 Tax=Flavobacterium sp. TaxID=239 RepID=UPI0011F6416F|nr:hypothetical protein [Flavobacterium sp.]RZJ71703.1 MAG: hypothetical protein EOO49_08530 [Flavobacterium sp.]
MKALTLKFFDVLERNLSLKEFENWLYSLENTDGLRNSALFKAFFNFNYTHKSGYEFSKLLTNFNTDEYALYKFENTLKQILSDGNLFRVVRSAHDFSLRYDYPLFAMIGEYDYELQNEYLSYETTRQKLAATAESLLQQWISLRTPAARLDFLKGKIEVSNPVPLSPDSAYVKFAGRLWNFWKN